MCVPGLGQLFTLQEVLTMKVFTAAVALLLSFGVIVTSQSPEREYVLDLTVPGIRFSAAPPQVDGIAFSEQQIHAIPLELVLTHVDRATYRLGDEASYEITLRNTSDRPVTLPWSVDLAAIHAIGRPFVQVGVSLLIEAAESPNALIGLVSLAGSAAVEGSTVTLAPKERAVIRIKAHTRLGHELGGRVAGLGVTPVRAQLTLRTEPHVLWQPLLSKNKVLLEFVMRQ